MVQKIEHFIEGISELGLKIYDVSEDGFLLEFSFDVFAKPGSKKEKKELSGKGELVLYFSARPVDGEANKAIFKILSKSMGVPLSHLSFERGQKSKIKRLRVKLIFTNHKGVEYYLGKWQSLLTTKKR
jgi:uncharacterized protein YggU (UPF0235/DUF167 family)